MAHLCDDATHQGRPDPVAGSRAFRVASQLFNLDVGLVDESEIDMHFKVVINVFELLDEIVAWELGGKIEEGTIPVAAAKCSRNVEEDDDATTVLVHVLDHLAVKGDKGSTY